MTYEMVPMSEVDPQVVIDMHGLAHVGDLLNTPTVDDVVRRSKHESSNDFVAFDSAGAPAGLLLMDRSQPWLLELSRIISVRESNGIGSFIMQWALHYAFEEQRVHRVFLEVHERNVRARRLYERFGFAQEGSYRDGVRNPERTMFENLCPYRLLEGDYRRGLLA